MLTKSSLSFFAVVLCTSAALGSAPSNRIAPNVGIVSDKGQFPFQAFITRSVESDPRYICGGAIISNRHILTAASCIESIDSSLLTVFVGANETYSVKKVTPHYLYIYGKNNNIALLHLSKALELNELVKPITFNSAADLEDVEVTALGTHLSVDKRLLKHLHVFAMSSQLCRYVLYSRGSAALDNLDDERTLCTYRILNDGIQVCGEDLGHPLVYRNELVGILTTVDGCSGLPAVYVRVSAYAAWILRIVKSTQY